MIALPPRLRRVTLAGCAALAAAVWAPAVASAHIELLYPTPRTLELKHGPCGAAGSTRGTNVIVLPPGATVEVRWKETINHPGHYRISFDLDGQDFVVPPTANGTTEGMPNVIKDLIPDRVTSGTDNLYSQSITLPDMTCETCTLQVIQLMTDKPPYTTDALSDDIYYQCADIALRRPQTEDASVPPDVDAPTGADAGVAATDLTGGCGCRTSQGQAPQLALTALVLGIAWRRRRRA